MMVLMFYLSRIYRRLSLVISMGTIREWSAAVATSATDYAQVFVANTAANEVGAVTAVEPLTQRTYILSLS
jgi:hypothetical protein